MEAARRIRSYLLITFASTWCIAGIGALAGIRASSGISYVLLAAACMLMPALSAIVQQRLIDKAPWAGLGLHPRTIKPWKLAATVLAGCAIVPLALLVCHVLGDLAGISVFGHVDLSNEGMIEQLRRFMAEAGKGELPAAVEDRLAGVPGAAVIALGLGGAVLGAFTINLPFMLGEELGWRGYLYAATANWSVLRRVLFTGVVWGLWHAPLILMGHNYPQHPWLGIPLMVAFCTVLALLFDWSRTRVRAVWGPCVLHGIINGSAGLFMLFASGGHPLVTSPAGLAGITALALLGLVVLVLDRAYGRGHAPTGG